MVETVANEIGTEFWGGTPQAEPVDDKPLAAEVFDTPQVPLENMARSVFAKADVQKRLTSLERAVDSLGGSLKPEIVEIREELSFLRLLMDDILHEVREISRTPGSGKKKSA